MQDSMQNYFKGDRRTMLASSLNLTLVAGINSSSQITQAQHNWEKIYWLTQIFQLINSSNRF